MVVMIFFIQNKFLFQNSGGVKNKARKLKSVFEGSLGKKSTRQDAVKSYVVFNENQLLVELFFFDREKLFKCFQNIFKLNRKILINFYF
jgi:hypothetical protein